jgi:hypothetical protein
MQNAVECLLYKQEGLNSNSSLTKKKKCKFPVTFFALAFSQDDITKTTD